MSTSSRTYFFRASVSVLYLLRWIVMVFVFGLLCYALFAIVSAFIPVEAEILSGN